MKITLKNNKNFEFENEISIFHAAKNAGIILEHSCLTGRCRSCIVKVLSGETVAIHEDFVLSDDEKKDNFILSCNSIPVSDLRLDIEDLADIKLYEKKIIPSKINSLENFNDNVLKLVLRLPPTSKFKFHSGQYVNLIKGNLKRSYSISNKSENKNQLEFFIKKYENGLMSNYLFEEARVNDLLRVEGPLGSFFLRDTESENIVFLGTGTGVAPIKSILDDLEQNPERFVNKNLWVFIGGRYQEDLFWEPNYSNLKLNFVKVLSREKKSFQGFKGYVQDALLNQNIQLENSQVYACGSSEMINAARLKLIKNGLRENQFFSDAFVQTN